MIRMTEMYRSKLNIDVSQARELAKITKGYAYAFQELGVLCFKKKENETLEDILSKLKSELFAYSYEKIWEEMTEMDRNPLIASNRFSETSVNTLSGRYMR